MHDRLIPLGWNTDFERAFVAYAQVTGDPDLQPGRVGSVQKASFQVHTGDGVVSAVPAGALLRAESSEQGGPPPAYPAIGDFVVLRQPPGGEQAVLLQVLPRQTRFSRALSSGAEQVIATNIDFVFIVTGLDDDFNVRRIERYVAAVGASGARPVVVLNKSDLHPDVGRYRAEVESAAPGVPVHALSALDHPDDPDLGGLRAYFTPGATVALIGSSGAGKSTLTNALLGRTVAATGAVRAGDSRGRHTTTARQLYLLPGSGVLIDNPGLREIAAWTDAPAEGFGDIEELATHCRYRGCTHTGEPGCAVRAALAAGTLDPQRFEQYQRSTGQASPPPRRPRRRA